MLALTGPRTDRLTYGCLPVSCRDDEDSDEEKNEK